MKTQAYIIVTDDLCVKSNDDLYANLSGEHLVFADDSEI